MNMSGAEVGGRRRLQTVRTYGLGVSGKVSGAEAAKLHDSAALRLGEGPGDIDVEGGSLAYTPGFAVCHLGRLLDRFEGWLVDSQPGR
jgi:hypothetical protein